MQAMIGALYSPTQYGNRPDVQFVNANVVGNMLGIVKISQSTFLTAFKLRQI
jgi:hypothetical protein